MSQNKELAKALFAAFQAGDADAVRHICTPDMRARQNLGPPMDIDALLAFSVAVNRLVQNFHYAEAIRSSTDSGFVEEHRVRGTLPDGSDLDLAVCVVGEVRDDKVSYLREYVDSTAAQGLMLALAEPA